MSNDGIEQCHIASIYKSVTRCKERQCWQLTWLRQDLIILRRGRRALAAVLECGTYLRQTKHWTWFELPFMGSAKVHWAPHIQQKWDLEQESKGWNRASERDVVGPKNWFYLNKRERMSLSKRQVAIICTYRENCSPPGVPARWASRQTSDCSCAPVRALPCSTYLLPIACVFFLLVRLIHCRARSRWCQCWTVEAVCWMGGEETARTLWARVGSSQLVSFDAVDLVPQWRRGCPVRGLWPN